jgi:predicted metal-dependent phosphoesterase TrpH
MGKADLHVHTIYSWDGTASVSAVLKQAVDVAGLDVIAITDHDEIAGALEAMTLAPAYGIEVIPGCEITSADGHVLALFINQRVPPGLSLVETARRVGELGGLCIAAHPSARGTSSLQPETIRQALADPEAARSLVGIEVYNGGLIHRRSNPLALELAETLQVAQVGNSDAHTLDMVGQGATRFDGRSALDLYLALKSGQTQAIVNRPVPPWHIIRNWLSSYLLRSAGWVMWSAHPQAPLKLHRLARQSARRAAHPVFSHGSFV